MVSCFQSHVLLSKCRDEYVHQIVLMMHYLFNNPLASFTSETNTVMGSNKDFSDTKHLANEEMIDTLFSKEMTY